MLDPIHWWYTWSASEHQIVVLLAGTCTCLFPGVWAGRSSTLLLFGWLFFVVGLTVSRPYYPGLQSVRVQALREELRQAHYELLKHQECSP